MSMTTSTKNSVQALAVRLAEITMKAKELKKEETEIRDRIKDRLKQGDFIKFNYSNADWRIMFEEHKSTVLKTNEEIAKLFGKAAFLRIATVSYNRICEIMGAEAAKLCIEREASTFKLVLRDMIKQNGKEE